MSGMKNQVQPPWGDRIPTAEEVDRFVDAMKPGETVMYYEGSLANDRELANGDPTKVATLADNFYVNGAPSRFCFANGVGGGRAINGRGKGHLTQRRLGCKLYQYFFTRGT